MKFKFLKKNDIADVVCLGTACTFDENIKIKNFLKKIDLTPRIFFEKELTLKKSTTHEFPSFSAKQRFEQFKKAVNSDSKIIWCARGGYGSAEILPFLEKMPKPKTTKIFIGFSDVSSLNNFLITKWNWQIISAPMLAQIVLEKVSDKSAKAISDFIFGKKIDLKYKLNILIPAKKPIKTEIVGGCFSVLAGQFGTKHQIDFNKKILFLEDEGEDGERLDRYFWQLTQIMLEQKKYPQAIILGNFMETNPHGTPKQKNITLAIEKFAANLIEKNLPIALFEEKTKCLGHSKNMLPLALGNHAEISDSILSQKF
jgi:muramoyltetrapeptide carboxypeptidase